MPGVSGRPYDRVMELLAADPRVRLVYGFGSAASDIAGPLSDVDVAVLLDARLDWDAERELRGRLGALVPRLDLVILNEAPPALRFEIITSGDASLPETLASRRSSRS